MNAGPKKRDFVVTRVFNAPVRQVCKTWSDPGLVMRWWEPAGFTCPVAKMDSREGGTSLVCMRAPKEVRNEVTFKELGKDKTEVTVTEYGWMVGQMMEMSRMGLEQCLDKMAALFAK